MALAAAFVQPPSPEIGSKHQGLASTPNHEKYLLEGASFDCIGAGAESEVLLEPLIFPSLWAPAVELLTVDGLSTLGVPEVVFKASLVGEDVTFPRTSLLLRERV